MKTWAVGIGATNHCNLNCPHCYSRAQRPQELSIEDFCKIVDSIQIDSLNFGTGESFLNPNFPAMLEIAFDRNIRTSITSNGFTILNLKDKVLQRLNDIDISLEFPTREQQGTFRTVESWDCAVAAIEKCINLGIDISIACCMMNINYKDIPGFSALTTKYDATLRINVFKPVNTEKYLLSYEQFWEGMRGLFREFRVISCSEPILKAVLGYESKDAIAHTCGENSIRINPDGSIVPCVYWKSSEASIHDEDVTGVLSSSSFEKTYGVPYECRKCSKLNVCMGGCPGRRYYTGIDKPDIYCPFIRNKTEDIEYRISAEDDRCNFVHSDYLCTLILRA